jgi:hypothetical protein
MTPDLADAEGYPGYCGQKNSDLTLNSDCVRSLLWMAVETRAYLADSDLGGCNFVGVC